MAYDALAMRKPHPSPEQSRSATSVAPASCSDEARGGAPQTELSVSRGLEAVLDPVPGAWFFTRQDGTFAYVSLKACAWLGYTRAETKTLTIFDIDPVVTPEYWRNMWGATRPPDSLTVRTTHRRKDGTCSPVEVRAVRVLIDGEDLAVSSVVDLTDTEETREALVATQAELQRLLDHVPDLVFRLRAKPTPQFSFVSPSSEQLLGYLPQQLVASEEALRRVVHADDLAHFLSLDDSAAAGKRVRFIHRAGRTVWMELRAIPLPADVGGSVIVEGVARDVTEAYHREQLQEQLHQARKMEALGQLAGGIAHDFGNLLQVIQTNTQLARTSPDHPELDSLLGGVLATADRASALVRQLLAFSRKGGSVEFAPLELRGIIDSLHAMLAHLLGSQVRLSWSRPDEALFVVGNATQLEQLVVNLCINARDALPSGGRVQIALRQIATSAVPAAVRGQRQAHAESYALLTIEDDGLGMSVEVQQHMYEPFFSTKALDRGTGLGLSTVYGVVQAHQGMIDVRSAPGEGTTFYVFLPVWAAPSGSWSAMTSARHR